MSEIGIVYIDDQIDEILSRYISQIYCANDYKNQSLKRIVTKFYEEVKFEGELSYENLLSNSKIRSANVILIDNHLFEERSAGTGKFSGKQFKIILRKLFPFIEVLIITQDKSITGDNIIHKFSGRHGENPELYYKEHLDHILNDAIKNILEFELLADDLKRSTDVKKTLVDKILQSLLGDDSYDGLTKADIDSLICSFRELRDSCENLR